MRSGHSRRLLGAVVGATLAVALAQVPATAGTATHGLRQRGAPHGSGTTSNLRDNGGPILPTSEVYVIWWGPSSAWSGDVQPGIASFFQGLNGSSYANTATQYMRGASLSINLKATAHDSSTPPKRVSPSTLAAEAAKEFPTADSNGLYFVFTSNFPNGGGYCAWHSYGTVNGVQDGVAYMPNTTNVAGCNPGNLYGLSGSEGLRSLANVSAHEFMEAITDALISAWYDSSGSEIGDKCAWQFTGPVTLSNSSTWQLQEEWSNATSGCVQTT